jgi:hypothetical protein
MVGGVDEPIPSHLVLPEPFEIPAGRLAGGGVGGERQERRLHASLDLGWQMTEDLRHVRRDLDRVGRSRSAGVRRPVRAW